MLQIPRPHLPRPMPVAGATGKLLLTFGGMRYRIETLEQASLLFQMMRDRAGIGASDLDAADGDIVEGARIIASVSYNGRVWARDGQMLLEAQSAAAGPLH